MNEAVCFPVFLRLDGRRVLVVGAGPVAASKLEGLLRAGAHVTIVAPDIVPAIDAMTAPGAPDAARLDVQRRAFAIGDLDDVWFVVAAATPEVNRAVSEAAAARHLFVNAVDDPPNATVYLGGVVRRDGVTVAISTDGRAPALAGLLREGLDALLPTDLDRWSATAHLARTRWKAEGVPMEQRRPQLLQALVDLYAKRDRLLHAVPDGPRENQPPRPDAAPLDPDAALVAASEALLAGRDAREARDTSDTSEASDMSDTSDGGPRGFVSLVGAGPGDPELLTQRAVKRLEAADLVLYDALVSPDLLPIAAHAQKLSVGKRACRPAISQETINRVLVRAARRGRRVVRLKCGDPFVFGRGGEEAIALTAAGVAFEVVPGISSALAAPALAGIPVTHRGVTASFLVVSGHSESTYGPVLDRLSPGSTTLVVLMGVGTRAALAARLIALGWAARTPAAVLLSASTPEAGRWTGTLDALAARADGLDVQPGESPGTLVIGEVVALASQIGLSQNWLTEYVGETSEVAHGSGR